MLENIGVGRQPNKPQISAKFGRFSVPDWGCWGFPAYIPYWSELVDERTQMETCMLKPEEPIVSGVAVLKKGRDHLIRGDRNIIFHFAQPDLSSLSLEEGINTIFVGIPETDPSTGAFGEVGHNGLTLRYRVKPSRDGQIIAVTYTVVAD